MSKISSKTTKKSRNRKEPKAKTKRTYRIKGSKALKKKLSKSLKHDANNGRSTQNQQKGPPIHPEKYENLVLYYLTKLKNLFSSCSMTTTNNRNVKRKNTEDRRSNFRNKPTLDATDHEIQNSILKDKAYNVVSAAIDYGFANDVIEKRGDYFILKTAMKPLTTRSPTPGPNKEDAETSSDLNLHSYFGHCKCNSNPPHSSDSSIEHKNHSFCKCHVCEKNDKKK